MRDPTSPLHGAVDSSRIIAVIGPTAVGKTSVSIDLALRANAEIVSIDSRQIYKELNIGTAKPTATEQKTVPHHLVDERSISKPVTAAEYAGLAMSLIDDIRRRNTKIILVGGSTLYLHAILFGVDDVPPTDERVREELSDWLNAEGLEPLVAELKQVDPEAADRIDLSNPRRVLRALEVYRSTGNAISSFWTTGETSWHEAPVADIGVFVLNRPRDILYDRIERRVDRMYEAGLVAEVEAILEAGHSSELQAMQTIGYKETIAYLRGEYAYDRMVELVKRNTRRYAKRQLTWFRRYAGFQWIELGTSATSSA